jgi:hypothetical protein
MTDGLCSRSVIFCKGSAASDETSDLPTKPAGKPAFSRYRDIFRRTKPINSGALTGRNPRDKR